MRTQLTNWLLLGALSTVATAEEWTVEYILPNLTLADPTTGKDFVQVSYGTQETYTTDKITYAETINMNLLDDKMFAYGDEYRLFQCFSQTSCRVYIITYPTSEYKRNWWGGNKLDGVRQGGITLDYMYASFPSGTDMRDPEALQKQWSNANYFSSSISVADILLDPFSETKNFDVMGSVYDPSQPNIYSVVSSEVKDISATLSSFTASENVTWDWLDYRTKDALLCDGGSSIEFDLNDQVLVYGIVFIGQDSKKTTSMFEDKAIEYFESRAAYQAQQCKQTVVLTDKEEKYEEFAGTNKVFGEDGSQAVVDPDTGTKTVVVEAGEQSTVQPSFEELFKVDPVDEQGGNSTDTSGSGTNTTDTTNTGGNTSGNSTDTGSTNTTSTTQNGSGLDTALPSTDQFQLEGAGQVSDSDGEAKDHALTGLAVQFATIAASLVLLIAQ